MLKGKPQWERNNIIIGFLLTCCPCKGFPVKQLLNLLWAHVMHQVIHSKLSFIVLLILVMQYIYY